MLSRELPQKHFKIVNHEEIHTKPFGFRGLSRTKWAKLSEFFWFLAPDSGYASATKKPIEATAQSWGRQLRSTGRFAKVARVLSNTNFANTFVGASRASQNRVLQTSQRCVSGCFGVTICCWFSDLRPELSESVLTWQSKLGGAKLDGKNIRVLFEWRKSRQYSERERERFRKISTSKLTHENHWFLGEPYFYAW